MNIRQLMPISIVLILASNFIYAETKPQNPITDNENLIERKSRFFDEFFIKQSTQLSQYKKVLFLDSLVTFDKDWLKDNRMKVSSKYKDKTKARYSKLFKEQLTRTFEKDTRFTVVNEKAKDVLVIAANINDLDIYGPDDKPQIKQYVYRAGEGQLQASLKTHSGETLATFEDRRESTDRGRQTPTRASSILNERDFRLLMKKWAKQLAKHIASN